MVSFTGEEMGKSVIYLTGDTHAGIGRLFGTIPSKEGDVIIVLGDFGVIFTSFVSSTEEKALRVLEKLKNKGVTVLFVDGNHENFNRINYLLKVEMFGGLVGKYTDNCFHLLRGSTYNILGHKFLSIGGAYSIDKGSRMDGVSWWKEEQSTYKEQCDIIDKVSNLKDIDYVISHECPRSISDVYIQQTGSFRGCYPEDTTSTFLNEVYGCIPKFKKWFFGHWHDNWDYGPFTMLYEQVYQLRGANE